MTPKMTGTSPGSEETSTLPVHPDVTDAVTQANIKVLGEAPAMALGMLYQVMATSSGLDLEDADQIRNALEDATPEQMAVIIDTLLYLAAQARASR